MRVDDILRHRQRHIVSHPDSRLCPQDHLATKLRMRAHLHQLVGGQGPRLVEDVIANAHLADVVERRETREKIDAFGCEMGAEIGLSGELRCEQARVLLRPSRMTARLGVANFRQRQQCLHHKSLCRGFLPVGGVCAAAQDRERRQRHHRQRCQHADRRRQRRDEQSARREQPRFAPPERSDACASADHA